VGADDPELEMELPTALEPEPEPVASVGLKERAEAPAGRLGGRDPADPVVPAALLC